MSALFETLELQNMIITLYRSRNAYLTIISVMILVAFVILMLLDRFDVESVYKKAVLLFVALTSILFTILTVSLDRRLQQRIIEKRAAIDEMIERNLKDDSTEEVTNK